MQKDTKIQSQVNILDGLKRTLDITVDIEQVKNAFNTNYIKQQKKAKLPGFRLGKVPLNHIRSMYATEIKNDTTIFLVNKYYLQALQQHKLNPASEPQIKLKADLNETKIFEFSATLDIQPTVNINKDFKLQLTKPSVIVEEKDINKTIQQIRLSAATFTLVTEKRGVIWGDIVELKIKELSGSIGIEKSPLLEIKKDHGLEMTGLIENLIDTKVGETKTLTVTLSKKYPIPEHQNKTAQLEVTLQAIKTKKLPEVNQDFLDKFKCKDLSELKKMIRINLEKEKKEASYNSMKEEALKQIVNQNKIDSLPEFVVKNQIQYIINSTIEHLKKSNMSQIEITKYTKKYQKEFETQAHFIVQSSYLIYALASQLNISSSPEEIKIYLQNIKPESDKYTEEYEKTKNFLIREKTLEHLIKEATKN